MLPLPIDSLLPEIVSRIQQHSIVLLEAEPGAGKTTRVPSALLAAGFAHIYVLEPRRLAARMAARRVAEELNEPLGQRVGYQVRYEEISSTATRLWFLTEGVLTRRLLSDPQLTRVQLVILDEFHERHLETDLALALLRRLQRQRPKLRLLLMSATLGAEHLAEQLPHAYVLKAPGRVFPVTIEYTPNSAAPLEDQVAGALSRVLPAQKGHTLIFLPGAAEIRRTLTACAALARQANARLLPLYGDLSAAEQDDAVAPSNKRKIICSTNVAESSLTIDGVDAVIDTGLARVLSHSPWSDVSRLEVEKISQSSAIQRAGRAGRTGPGRAIRLYPESDFVRRPQTVAPEILRADLAPVLLQLAAFGFAWNQLQWLDEPAIALQEQAQALLVRLELLRADGALSELGQRASRLPLHPRWARFVLAAADFGTSREALPLAARLSAGRVRIEDNTRGAFASDLDAVLAAEPSYAAQRLEKQLAKNLPRTSAHSLEPHGLEKALLLAFPDRVARRRGENVLLSSGVSAKLDRGCTIQSEFFVAVEIEDRSSQPLIRMASPIQPDWLLDLFPDRVEAREEIAWNREAERVEQVNSLHYDELLIDESRSTPVDRQAASRFLADKALEAGPERFTDPEELSRFLRRLDFAAPFVELPPRSELLAQTLQQLSEDLAAFSDLRTAARDGGFLATLRQLLPMRVIDEIAPSHIVLGKGRRARIEYHDQRPPSVSSRLQDFFGMRETPTVANGRVPLVVELLAPNHRPVQVTTDLVSFWKNLYPQLRRELGRRYPKHSWPETPL